MFIDSAANVEFAVGTVVLQDTALEPVLAKIAEAGFRHVELLCESPHFGEPGLSVSQVRQQFDKLSLSMETAHSPYVHVDLGAGDEMQRRKAVDWIASFFVPMAALGAKCIVVHPNQHLNRAAPEKNRLKTRQSLIELADRATDSGIRIALENVMRYKERRTGDSINELLEIIHELPPSVGLCLDTGHAVIAGRDPVEELKLGARRIFHLHLHDNDVMHDHHWVPGDGVIRWDDVIETMRQIGFAGSATIEIVSSPDDAEEALGRCRHLALSWKDALTKLPDTNK